MIDAIRIKYVLTRLLKKGKCRLRRLRLSNRVRRFATLAP